MSSDERLPRLSSSVPQDSFAALDIETVREMRPRSNDSAARELPLQDKNQGLQVLTPVKAAHAVALVQKSFLLTGRERAESSGNQTFLHCCPKECGKSCRFMSMTPRFRGYNQPAHHDRPPVETELENHSGFLPSLPACPRQFTNHATWSCDASTEVPTRVAECRYTTSISRLRLQSADGGTFAHGQRVNTT